MSQVSAYLSLGSNLGDRCQNIEFALSSLHKVEGVSLGHVSSLYETEPVGIRNQPLFLNCAIEVFTSLSPVELLATCKNIEEALGSVKPVRWGPRILDVDILLYGGESICSRKPPLIIPHPEMLKRFFVLVPLAEICPKLTIPVEGGRTVLEALSRLSEHLPEKGGIASMIKPFGILRDFR